MTGQVASMKIIECSIVSTHLKWKRAAPDCGEIRSRSTQKWILQCWQRGLIINHTSPWLPELLSIHSGDVCIELIRPSSSLSAGSSACVAWNYMNAFTKLLSYFCQLQSYVHMAVSILLPCPESPFATTLGLAWPDMAWLARGEMAIFLSNEQNRSRHMHKSL